jgi:hypothetical protein
MSPFSSHRLALPILALLALAPSSSGQRSARPGPRPVRGIFEIVSCSLGCVPGPSVIGCGITDIHVNEELRITFNRPVDPASVNNNSFQVRDVSGITPPGSFRLDPADANTLIYRPQMTFDSAGDPLFGLVDGRTYLLRLPGLSLDPLGPHVTSVDGLPNQTRMQCLLVASLGVADAVPGRPVAKLFVRAVIGRDPLSHVPVEVATVAAEGATDVLRSSPIEIVFADLMNPATVANPVTGTSTFIRVFFDPDGNLQDVSDQVLVPGSFTLTLDQVQNTTRAVFQALGGLPASGSPLAPGRVVVNLSPLIQDLAGNTLANAGTTSFTTEAR